MVSNKSGLHPEKSLAEKIKSLKPEESEIETLSVDDRVLARVTDGMYRQSSSAIREVISNAYDADATQVVVHTDAPRFERIRIEDNGIGMSPDVLAYLIKHIGGSSKRTQRGVDLGTVSDENIFHSKAGRRLIGKIGIGMFAVSQLTQHFQIITKQKGDDFQTSAVVLLETHTEELLTEPNGEFRTGQVIFTRDPTSDIEAHGTTIVLMNLRKSAKDDLGSVDKWTAIEESKSGELHDGLLSTIEEPVFHIGRISPNDRKTLILPPQVPWENHDLPAIRFGKLYKAVAGQVGMKVANPTTEAVLDNYLKMLWDISLAIPVDYIDRHPFEMTPQDGIEIYELSNHKRGQASSLDLKDDETIAHRYGMESCSPDPAGGFRVIIDGVELRHPITIESTLQADSAQRKPLLFVGKCITPFDKIPPNRGGGALEFEAYIYWNPIIAPKENNGVLIRVNNSSGTLFDETFIDYRVSELTRLKQLMMEVFVTKGLDPALNIDRESFNSSHPHYQFIKDWVHRSIRQATNRLKAINKQAMESQRGEKQARVRDSLLEHAEMVWSKLQGDDSPVPKIEIVEQLDFESKIKRQQGKIVLEYEIQPLKNSTAVQRQNEIETHTAQIKALIGILAAYGLIENMPYERLESLVRDIDEIYHRGGG